MATEGQTGGSVADQAVRVDAAGVAHPVGRGARVTLRKHQGSTLQMLSTPKHVLVFHTHDFYAHTDSKLLSARIGEQTNGHLAMAGEIGRSGRLLDLCSMFAQARWSGELAVCSHESNRSITLLDGQVVGAYSDAKHERLGAVLAHFGQLSPAQISRVVRSKTTEQRFGDAAVALGLLSHEVLFRYLRKQTELIVYSALAVMDGTFTFYQGASHPHTYPMSFPLTELLYEAVRRMDELEFFKARIPSVQYVPVAVEGHRPPKEEDGQRLVDAMNAVRSIEQVAAIAELDAFEATRIIFHLLQLGSVTLRPPHTPEVRGVVEIFNQAIVLILAEVDHYRDASQDIRDSLASFASYGAVYATIFRDAGPKSDGTLDVTVTTANARALRGTGDPEAALAEWLYEYASFAMFIAEPVLRAGAESDASAISARVAALLAPLAPEL